MEATQIRYNLILNLILFKSAAEFKDTRKTLVSNVVCSSHGCSWVSSSNGCIFKDVNAILSNVSEAACDE